MFSVLLERARQRFRTMSYPAGTPPPLPERWLGGAELSYDKCNGCEECSRICPSGAIRFKKGLHWDSGACLFCGECAKHCQVKAVRFGKEYRLARFTRAELAMSADAASIIDEAATAKRREIRKLFGRSFQIRQVSAGGCNACEADANVLSTIGWDLSRFGIRFVASPRHADALLVTGPVSDNMRLALEKTYAATPTPKIVIACGACAISGGPHSDSPVAARGVDGLFPVDLYVPGCPPHPLVLLEGLLRFLGVVDDI